jgi:caa(3)-type oxidase subunit IV
MSAEAHGPSHEAIWLWLIALLVVGLVVAFLPFGKAMAIFLIFSVAAVKATLVARHYMHLGNETLLIYVIAGVPVLLLVGLALALVPDIVFNHQ